MKSSVFRHNNYKHWEAQQLCAYLKTLTRKEHCRYVSRVIALADVKRHTFYNWKYMCCQIPGDVLNIMESVAEQRLFFPPVKDMNTEIDSNDL